ncbi:MAG TPA: glycosyltransferase [Gemmatimonadales bacterium]|nr:glycosyltransferase [Gemmatimonadales bacterium]
MSRTVLHFTDSDQFGGTERALLQVLAGLDRSRWRPVLLHRPESGLAPLLQEARHLGVELRTVPQLRGVQGWARLPALVQQIRRERAAVFHAHLTWPLACRMGLLGAALARVPAVVATAQLFVDLPPSGWTTMQHRVVSACVDRYLAVSRQVAAQLRERFGVRADKITQVPNAVALDRFPRAVSPAPARPADPAAPQTVLTVARLDPQKGLHHLVAAAALVPEARVMVVGEGPERPALETEIARLGLGDRVHLLGFRSDVPDLLAASDLFVLPSLFEGLPLSILEAMAAGKPVVATAIGGNDEAVVDGATGLLVPPGDPQALADAIRALLRDPERRRRLGEAGRRRAEAEFSATAMVRRVAAVYDELLAASDRPGDGA